MPADVRNWPTSADFHVAQSGSATWDTSDVPHMLSAQPLVTQSRHRGPYRAATRSLCLALFYLKRCRARFEEATNGRQVPRSNPARARVPDRCSEALDPSHMVMLGLLRELANRHVPYHAPTQLVCRLFSHEDAPVLSEDYEPSSQDRTHPSAILRAPVERRRTNPTARAV
jgi:hypothetical protein